MVEQVENHPPGGPNNSDSQHDCKEANSPETTLHWPLGTLSSPIKGFSTDKVMENLDPQVRSTWELEAQGVVFVHYLDSGYNPDITQNVHTIAEDLKSKHDQNKIIPNT